MHENRVFFTRGSSFASTFPSRQAFQNDVYHDFEKQIYIFVELLKFYIFVLK